MKIDRERLATVLILVGGIAVAVLVLRRIANPPVPTDSTFFASATENDYSRRMLRAEGRAETARELGRNKPPNAIKFLVPYLKDDAPAVRIACAEALAEIDDRQVVPDLRARLDSEPDPAVRSALVKALDALSLTTAALKLEQKLKAEDPNSRLEAVNGLGDLRGNDVATRALIAALSDEDEAVRDAATEHLVRTDDLAFSPLQSAAESASPELARRIVNVLAGMRSSDTVPTLLAVLGSAETNFGATQDYRRLRQTVLAALEGLGEPATIPLVRVGFHLGDQPAIQQVATDALASIGGPMAIFLIRTCALEDWKSAPADEEVTRWLTVLDRVGGKAALDARRRIEEHVALMRRSAELGAVAVELDAARLTPFGQVPPKADPEDCLYALALDQALGAGKPLMIHLDRRDGRFVRAFGSASRYNRASHAVDASALKLDGAKLSGIVRVTLNPDMYVPPNFQSLPCEFALLARIDGTDVAGTYGGRFGGDPVRGRVIGLAQARSARPDPAWFHLMLPQALDGINGPIFWHAGWLSFLVAGGKAYDGQLTAYDQLAMRATVETGRFRWFGTSQVTWKATVSRADATFTGGELTATVKSEVASFRGPYNSFGPHTFRFTGQVIGKLTAGKYDVLIEDTPIFTRAFVGTVWSEVAFDPALRNASLLLILDGALPGEPLRIALDRLRGETRLMTRAVGGAPIAGDVSGLRLADRALTGTIRINIIDAETGKPVFCEYALNVDCRHSMATGTYEGTHGGKKVAGGVSGEIKERAR